MLILPGTTFDAVNFGESKGDIGNMVLRPVRNMAIGAIPVINCAFRNCEFHALGFTGNEQILGEILAISPRTVNKHLEQVFPKLGVENRTAAAGIALRCLDKDYVK